MPTISSKTACLISSFGPEPYKDQRNGQSSLRSSMATSFSDSSSAFEAGTIAVYSCVHH